MILNDLIRTNLSFKIGLRPNSSAMKNVTINLLHDKVHSLSDITEVLKVSKSGVWYSLNKILVHPSFFKKGTWLELSNMARRAFICHVGASVKPTATVAREVSLYISTRTLQRYIKSAQNPQ